MKIFRIWLLSHALYTGSSAKGAYYPLSTGLDNVLVRIYIPFASYLKQIENNSMININIVT